jgi:hypothetical protein
MFWIIPAQPNSSAVVTVVSVIVILTKDILWCKNAQTNGLLDGEPEDYRRGNAG